MRHATLTVLALAAFNMGEAMAGPAHAHMHQQQHEKKDLKDVDWSKVNYDGVDFAAAYANGKNGAASKVAAIPAAVTAAATAAAANVKAIKEDVGSKISTAKSSASTSSASPSSGSGSSSGLLNGVVGASNNRKDFGDSTVKTGQGLQSGDSAVNNYGTPYGSNIIKVDSRKGYAFTNEYKNTQDKTITINIWNKVGPDLQAQSGAMLAPQKSTLTFTLAPGKSQIVAFQDNTQCAWAQATDKVLPSGQFDTVYGEANFKSSGGSGYNLSVIPKSDKINNYDMQISNAETPCVSNPYKNFWRTETDPVGDGSTDTNGSCYINAKTASLTTIMGGTMSKAAP